MFHILMQACLTEKQFKFGFNQKTIVSVWFFVVFDSLKLQSTNFSGHKNVKHLVGHAQLTNWMQSKKAFE